MEAYFPTPISSEPAVDDKGVIGWVLESLHTVPARVVSVVAVKCAIPILKSSQEKGKRELTTSCSESPIPRQHGSAACPDHPSTNAPATHGPAGPEECGTPAA